MHITSLRLANWRNYPELDISFDPGRNILRGENAQGKTNLLEAVYYLAAARGFRAGRDADLIADGAQAASVEATVALTDREIVLRAELRRGSRRKLSINGAPAKTASDFSGRLRAVLFEPNDLALVSGAPSLRRRFLDDALCQLRPRYAEALSRYSRLHEHKTRILRDGAENPSLYQALDAFDEQLARVGAVVVSYRAKFARGLSARAARLHSELSGGRETLDLSYSTSSCVSDQFAPEPEIAEQLLTHIRELRPAELSSGAALVGPHRDDLEIAIDGRPARTHASQGQTRTAALALKLAEREMFLDDSGDEPLLLLDDVLSELDDARRRYVLERVGCGQVIITLCGGEQDFANSRTFTVQNGGIVR